MISSLTKKERLLLTGITLTCLVTLFLFSFFFYSPQKERLGIKQEELKTEQKLLAAVEAKAAQIENRSYKDSKSLQSQIPVEPLTEQLILQLEKVEVESQSTIISMNFSKEDFTFLNGDNEDSDLGKMEGSSDEKVIEKDTSLVKRLQMTMTVESENYFAMEKFIHELENLPRIIEVNQLVFEGKEEMTPVLTDEEPEPYTYQVVASAYYLPELTDLKDSVPSIDSPPPSLKKNPFMQYTDPSAKEDESTNTDDGTTVREN